jgi:hypothetical protein
MPSNPAGGPVAAGLFFDPDPTLSMSAKTKPAAKKAAKKSSAKKAWFPGKMGKREIQPLVMAAREAYDYQNSLGNIDRGQTFDAWRRAEVKSKVGRDGLSACSHDDFKPLMGHFQLLAGRDGDALESFLSTGPAADTSAHGDDHERRRQLAHGIMEILAEHIALAEISAQDLAARTENPAEYQQLCSRRAAILAHKDGAIREGYIVHLAKQKTRRPDLTLGRDIQAGLADRCTVDQLTQLRDTLVNRIAVREDRPESEGGRNRKRRSTGDQTRRSIHELAPRFELPEPGECDPF